MIKIKNVTKRYGDFVAVDGLNLEVKPGEIMGIIGHNGAGKTTTLKMITGLINPTEGVIEVMGKDISKYGVEIKKRLGFLPEESPLYENMNVTEYLLFFAEIYGLSKKTALDRIDAILGSLKLDDRKKLTGELSKGMKRKVAIARSLLHDPELLILDEPNSGLDPLTSFFIIDYLKKLKNEGKTILVSAHNLFHIEYICDRVTIMKQGKLVVCDTMQDLVKKLGKREYQVIFRTDEKLDYQKQDDNYTLKTSDIAEMSGVLKQISERNWTLVDISMRQSALEEIYVNMMTEPVTV
ncbi:MAG: multidrug ABC transporter ATP-binding protein [Chloroflexi bacterium RBG_16_48_7]|nr:MAG: multidrug ABC transporter ATP-binding protein [Chloroflexi bacterium RBG_16_48_7]